MEPTVERDVLRLTDTGFESKRDIVIAERPVTIEVNGRPIAILMALPGHEEDLAAGFALTEGIIRRPGDLLGLHPCGHSHAPDEPVVMRLTIAADLAAPLPGPLAVRYACGALSRSLLAEPPPPLESASGGRVTRGALGQMLHHLAEAQSLYKATGGAHGAAVFDPTGALIVFREDVGRHNAADKVIGHCLRSGLPLDDKVLLTTGRASSEMALKAVVARIPVLAALSAPTALAVDWAQRFGLTLIAFLKPRRMNIYSHPERISPA